MAVHGTGPQTKWVRLVVVAAERRDSTATWAAIYRRVEASRGD